MSFAYFLGMIAVECCIEAGIDRIRKYRSELSLDAMAAIATLVCVFWPATLVAAIYLKIKDGK